MIEPVAPFAPRVSVVIPAHNAARFLPRTLGSVFTQTYPVWEVIVVNDGSTDGTAAVLEPWSDRVAVVHQPQQGVSAARNAGIAASRGDLIAFLDADDEWVPEKLARQVPLFANPAVGLVHCGIRYVDVEGRPLSTNLAGRSGRVLRDMALLRPAVQGGGSGPVVRAECFARVGAFDPALSISEDWDMWRRIACVYEIGMVREPLVRYRIHADSLHQDAERYERNMTKAVAKMFEDPLAREVHRLRRRSYGALYVMLSGSRLYAGDWSRCLAYAGRAVATWPPSALHLAGYPLRAVRRRLLGADDREPTVRGDGGRP